MRKEHRGKGKVFFLVIFLLVYVTLPGCDSGPSSGKRLEVMPSDIEVVQDITKEKSTLTDQDEDRLEIKHWKYGQPSVPRQSSPAITEPTVKSYLEVEPDNWQRESIQFVSREEMDRVVDRLVEMKYLENNRVTEDEFFTALEDYQRDRGLPMTGKLDGVTLQSLQ